MAELRYQLLICDWDGTISDSAANIVHCTQLSLAAAGLPTMSRDAILKWMGVDLSHRLVNLFPTITSQQIESFTENFKAMYANMGRKPQLFPGVEETLRHLNQAGMLLSVATGMGRHNLDRALADSGLGELMVFTRTADETQPKPHPQMALDLLDITGVEPGDAIIVGDTSFDLQLAVNAGIPSIGVTYGAHRRAQLEAYPVIALIDKFAALRNHLITKKT